MAMNNNERVQRSGESFCKFRKHLMTLRKKGLQAGMTMRDIQEIVCCPRKKRKSAKRRHWLVRVTNMCYTAVFFALGFALLVENWEALDHRCAVANNYIVKEVTRPEMDCNICQHVNSALILNNMTKDLFMKYAYSGLPILVRGATRHWSATDTFSFDYFKRLYNVTPNAYESVEKECQFLNFKTEFLHLSDVLNMPEDMANMSSQVAKPWYVGWSNCHPDIAVELRKHYSRPSFFPDDIESSIIDWIFMGYSGGATLHLDYVHRPSWQAQITGTKTWFLVPPPECEAVCHSFSVTVNKGDIILIDSNQWYHKTQTVGRDISITIGSEYD